MKSTPKACQMEYEAICNNIFEESKKNNLKLNVSKCNEMVFLHGGCKNKLLRETADKTLSLNGLSVPRVSTVKYLGLHISSDNKWDKRINFFVQKLNFIIEHLT